MGPKLFWGPPGGPLPLPAKARPSASGGAFFSISPEILKPIRRERRVANRRSNRPMAKIVLDRSSVPPIVGQLVADSRSLLAAAEAFVDAVVDFCQRFG